MSDDLGVSNERTALAWQRTALALTAGTAIMARLTYSELGWIGLVGLSVALPVSIWVFGESWARYSHHAGLRIQRACSRRGGRAAALVAVATILIADTELVVLLDT